MRKHLFFLSLGLLSLASSQAFALKLVSKETVKEQKKLTETLQLKNGIKVIYRHIPNSDILQVNLTFASGLKDLPTGKKVLNQWIWDSLSYGGKGWPKEKVFSTLEEYAIEFGCGGGIEFSSCSVGTLNEYWPKALPLLAAVVKEPLFDEDDANLIKSRLIARYKETPSDPGSYVNEIVNRIYYPKGHPYRLNHDEALAELEKLTPKDLKELHKQMLNADLMTFVVVGSMDSKELLKSLNSHFGDIKKGPVAKTIVQEPGFDLKSSLEFEDRDIPTAYIRAKTVAPAITDKDAVATRLLFEILSEELGEEIRTKRSLSYAVHAGVIQYSMGIGILSASTSKPKETLEAMNDVIKKIKSKTYSQAELDEYKTVFATAYFLTQETHASLASSLSTHEYFHNYEAAYEFPQKLDKVTPADIKRLANELLVDMHVGVIYNKDKFKQEWAMTLIKDHLKPKKKEAGH